MQLKAPKGTRDLSGVEVEAFSRLEEVARRVFKSFQFKEIRTPIFESKDLFTRSLGETSDVVAKEMFSFQDRGDRELVLRPEGTASVVRHFIEQSLAVKGGIHRFYYMGPMFRAERPQAGRYRQFWQIGSEYFGSKDPSSDADTVVMVATILNLFQVGEFTIEVNSLGSPSSRLEYRKALVKYLEGKKNILSEESIKRLNLNPLRVLDSKRDGPKLKNPPLIADYLSADSAIHYEEFLGLLRSRFSNIKENPRLVRGLDYYTETVFEIVSPHLGAQNALAAGGRYDELVFSLGGPSVPGVGFALGSDRVVEAHMSLQDKPKQESLDSNQFMVAPLVSKAVPYAYKIAQDLRDRDISVPPIIFKKKIKNQLSLAVDLGSNWIILIGDDELSREEVTLKDLTTREQVSVKISQVIDYIGKLRTKSKSDTLTKI